MMVCWSYNVCVNWFCIVFYITVYTTLSCITGSVLFSKASVLCNTVSGNTSAKFHKNNHQYREQWASKGLEYIHSSGGTVRMVIRKWFEEATVLLILHCLQMFGGVSLYWNGADPKHDKTNAVSLMDSARVLGARILPQCCLFLACILITSAFSCRTPRDLDTQQEYLQWLFPNCPSSGSVTGRQSFTMLMIVFCRYIVAYHGHLFVPYPTTAAVSLYPLLVLPWHLQCEVILVLHVYMHWRAAPYSGLSSKPHWFRKKRFTGIIFKRFCQADLSMSKCAACFNLSRSANALRNLYANAPAFLPKWKIVVSPWNGSCETPNIKQCWLRLRRACIFEPVFSILPLFSFLVPLLLIHLV